MTSAFTAIDLSQLPAPKVVEELSYEEILAAWKTEFLDRYPAAAAELGLESEPVAKLLETGAYRELILRQRVNDGARAVMLAFASGGDLDNLAALTPVARKTIHPGDPDAVPPTDPVMEPDDEFRARVQMAPEGFSTAGPDGAYIYHALSVTRCRDASVASPQPCQVMVTVLGRDGDGTPDATVLGQVSDLLDNALVRPLTDQVQVQAPEILTYTVSATLEFYDGPDTGVVLNEAMAQAQQYVSDRHRLGDTVTLSGLYAALHRPGVKKVNLAEPAADITAQAHQAPYCTDLSVEAA
ncbi:MAG: baseplate J/gp47 family protein [Desulfobacter sp.]